jgi:hypothetical protein
MTHGREVSEGEAMTDTRSAGLVSRAVDGDQEVAGDTPTPAAPLYALDPGTTHSALIRIAGDVVTGGVWTNEELVYEMREICWRPESESGHLVIESIESYGMAVGREIFETVFWSGRFAQVWEGSLGIDSWSLLPRRAVKLALCGSARAKDANIRQALIDKFGGSACIRKGGVLYGIKSHLWAALALGVTWQEQQR